MNRRKSALTLALVFAIAATSVAPVVSAGVVDGKDLNQQNVATQPAAASTAKPLAKVNTSTRTSFSFSFGGSCPGTTCTSGSCTIVQFSTGTVNVPGMGKSAVAGCIALDTSTAESNGTGGSCDDSSGTLTLTASKGSITLGLGGHACDVPPGAVAAETVEMNLVYIVTGGTGNFTTASGVGNVAGSLEALMGLPGIIQINGAIAAH